MLLLTMDIKLVDDSKFIQSSAFVQEEAIESVSDSHQTEM